ncbi:hypothetical protein BH10CYA1_BH10CYA1_43000 [soil metagenome]
MSRPSNTEPKRKQIVEALMSVMATCGYDGATIPLIAKAAGLTSGLVHYYFDSKQSILIELVLHLVRLVDARFQSAIKPDPKSELAAYIDAHLALGTGANPTAVACWICIGAAAVNQPEIRVIFQEATANQVTTLEGICERILRADGRQVRQKREIALGITAAIEGSYRLLISAPNMIPKGFASPTVKAMAFGLISSQPLASKNRST